MKIIEPYSLRRHIAQESAKIMVREQLDDYFRAKQKAAERLHVTDQRQLPDNEEINQALLEYLDLFEGDKQKRLVCGQRRAALEAMQFLADFDARLSGAVLRGTSNPHSEIELHLFCDSHEEVAVYLIQHNIPYQEKERVYQSANKRFPAYRFIAGTYTLRLVVFKPVDLRHAPPDPVDGKPVRRVTTKALEKLLLDSGCEG